MNRPLIVRVVLAKDWLEAYRAIFRETFGRAATGHEMPMQRIRWPEHRRLCLEVSDDAVEEWSDQELADAWPTLWTPDDLRFAPSVVALATAKADVIVTHFELAVLMFSLLGAARSTPALGESRLHRAFGKRKKAARYPGAVAGLSP
jgi:hypothetical protein